MIKKELCGFRRFISVRDICQSAIQHALISNAAIFNIDGEVVSGGVYLYTPHYGDEGSYQHEIIKKIILLAKASVEAALVAKSDLERKSTGFSAYVAGAETLENNVWFKI